MSVVLGKDNATMKSVPVLAGLLALLATATLAVPSSSINGIDTYDYIVIGSGPGGGPLASQLAIAGFSVLLLEAGADRSDNPRTSIPSLVNRNDPATVWYFFAEHYKDQARQLRYNLMNWRNPDSTLYTGKNPQPGAEQLGVFYPRGATLGGSAIVNAMTCVLPAEGDWAHIVDVTGDSSWSAEEMGKLYARMEKNFAFGGQSGHGSDGWLNINQVDGTAAFGNSTVLKTMLGAIAEGVGDAADRALEDLSRDMNDWLDEDRDETVGVFGNAMHATEDWVRWTPRDLVKQTVEGGYSLTLSLNSLATKILFDIKGKKPKATGVQYLTGQSLYQADLRSKGTEGTVHTARARKEVIVSGGTFNSPQLLKLSGIGPRKELAALKIPVILDRPGVGAHLQDNYEIPILANAAVSLSEPNPLAANCTSLAPGDPCLEQWKNGTGYYHLPPRNVPAAMYSTTGGERDMYYFTGTYAFRGFAANTTGVWNDNSTLYGFASVLMHGHNEGGSVTLKSADPQEPPEIFFNHFAKNADKDLGTITDGIAWARRVFMSVGPPLGPFTNLEPPCEEGVDENGYCGTDKEWVMDQVFGHHPTSTCSMGRKEDRLAVTDSEFRVIGADGLRVVDASVFPRPPGSFPVLPTFMVSQKALELILKKK